MKFDRLHFRVLFFSSAVLALLGGCAGWQPTASPRDQLAVAYGIENFGQVEALRYTFNVQLADRVIRRTWTWEPQKDRVTFRGTAEQGGTVEYERSILAGPGSESVKKVDAWFINDNYWLIFPLRLAWDRSATVTADNAPAPLPIGTGQARRLVVRYPSNEGYTPGDVYELFIGASDRIEQWIYRKGGDPQPTRITTWEDYRRVGPLTLALDHRGPDGSFRVWFTDVAVRVAGRSDWISAR